MVHWQLCTLEHLKNSGFGRPFPRHGLQLLFWFSNQCVTYELVNFVLVMKLASDCQPENRVYGFHLFGNIEELLPVLNRPRRGKSKVVYFEVGNLSTETYPDSANLPAYVRENYRLDGSYNISNIDRIIIGYRVRTRVVETVYVTEHDTAVFGRFRFDRTYEISSELIQAMQNPQLDLTTFLIQMGYYVNVFQGIEEIPYQDPSAQQMFNAVQEYSSSTAAQAQQLYMQPFSYSQNVDYNVNVTPHSGSVANHRKLQQSYNFWNSSWNQAYEAYSGKPKKWGGDDGFNFFKILLHVGALYLAVKCLSWLLRSSWNEDTDENIIKVKPQWNLTFRRWTPSCQRPHVMLDYVF